MLKATQIEAARRRIRDAILLSPCVHSESLSRLTGCELYLKLENRQITGSFKERGSLNKMLLLSKRERAAGVITASAGNHAQGVAHAARLLGIKATIVMPETTPLAKLRGTRELGATIVLHGGGYDEAYEYACTLRDAHGYTFVHAFDDPAIIAGQGTIGLELLEQVPDLELVLVPVGGGGLIAGIATAIKAHLPATRIVGVEAARMPAMQESVAAGAVRPLRMAYTIADGISVATVGRHTLPIVARHVSTVLTVTEEEIATAIMTLLEREKTLAEGAGVVGLAALLARQVPEVAGRRVAVVISGGNIDMTLLAKIIERGLESDGRVATVKVVVPDKPGSVAELARIIATAQANILNIAQNRHVSEVQLGEAEVELTLETRGREHVGEILGAIRDHGFDVK